MPSVFKHKNPFSEKMKGVFFIQPDAFFRQFITQARWLMA
jgi:hypothetical protein